MASTAVQQPQQAQTAPTKASDYEEMLKQAKGQEQPLSLLQHIIFSPEADAKVREAAIWQAKEALVRMAREGKSIAEGRVVNGAVFLEFIQSLEPVWASFPRPRPALLTRQLLDSMTAKEFGVDTQLAVCRYLLEWADKDKRVILKRTLESRQAALLFEARLFTEALAVIYPLMRELTRIDDKLALIEVQLLEGRIYMEVGNLGKAKAAFIAARTTGNLIVAPPSTQASLDLHSGRLYVEEGEPGLAYANFIEALDSFSSQKDVEGARRALRLMLLCKIMSGLTADIPDVLKGKLAAPHVAFMAPMVALSEAYASRSLADYDRLLRTGSSDGSFGDDAFVVRHLGSLYDSLLEGNLLKLTLPYARVQIAHLAASVGLSVTVIESRLCRMILDGSLHAIIDQQQQSGEGPILIMFEKVRESTMHADAMRVLSNLERVVEGLYEKAGKLH